MDVAAIKALEHRVLVRCPNCSRRAEIAATPPAITRIACPACGLAKELPPGRPGSALFRYPGQALAIYDGSNRPFDAALWLETTCCGGNRLWALNETHLAYLDSFVRSTQRDRDFPSPPGRRQLADKLPAWMTERKHRDDVLRAIRRLQATISAGS